METSYFQWLCDLVKCDRGLSSFYLLLGVMYQNAFLIKNKKDENRAEDGMSLRQEYLNEVAPELYSQNDIEDLKSQPCSILEMVIGISKRMAFELVEEEPGDEDFVKYFWEIIDNLGLLDFDDMHFNIIGTDPNNDEHERENWKKVVGILQNLNNRKYDRNGRGGMFPLKNAEKDQRRVEIWYQMQAYIKEKYPCVEGEFEW